MTPDLTDDNRSIIEPKRAAKTAGEQRADDGETSGGSRRGKPFPKGQSGNPAGRPMGSRNRVSVACEELLEGEAEALTRKAISKALEGDVLCLRICLERLVPARRERRARFNCPTIDNSTDVLKAFGEILQATSRGEMDVSQAQQLSGVLEGFRRTLELEEIERRLQKLEEITEAKNGKA